MTLFIRQLIQKLIKNLFQPYPGKKKNFTDDCGLFAIATATAVLFKFDAKLTYFSQNGNRSHLTKCFEEQASDYPIPPGNIITIVAIIINYAT